MPVTFNTAGLGVRNFHTDSVNLNESRIKRLMSGKKDEALYMGPWDRFRDLFREDKKAEVLEAFWKLMHPEESDGTQKPKTASEEVKEALDAFHKLMNLADESQRGLFNSSLSTDHDRSGYFITTDFSIKEKSVSIKEKSVRKITYYPSPGRDGQCCADLCGANLYRTDMICADLTGARLTGANLEGADLSGADLPGARLTDARLIYADLPGADLSGADLRGANLTRTNLNYADLNNAWLYGVTCDGVTLTRENFSQYFPRARNVQFINWEAEPTPGNANELPITVVSEYMN